MFERIKRKFERLLGLACWIGAGLCVFGIYKLAEMILYGANTGNCALVLAGGILIYLFGAVLGIVGIILTILGLAILTA